MTTEIEPQSLQKMNLKSVKRALDLFSPARDHIRKSDHNNEQIAPSIALPCEKVSTFLVFSSSHSLSQFWAFIRISISRDLKTSWSTIIFFALWFLVRSKVSNFYCSMNSTRYRRSQGSSKGRNRESFSCCWSSFTAKNLVSLPFFSFVILLIDKKKFTTFSRIFLLYLYRDDADNGSNYRNDNTVHAGKGTTVLPAFGSSSERFSVLSFSSFMSSL